MKKIFFLPLVFLAVISCNLKEQMGKLKKIETDLEEKFNHEEISSNYHWGTDKGDNFLQVSFYEYGMDQKTFSQLESTADSVFKYLEIYNGDFEDLEFMQVRFTKKKDEEAESFVSFKSDIVY